MVVFEVWYLTSDCFMHRSHKRGVCCRMVHSDMLRLSASDRDALNALMSAVLEIGTERAPMPQLRWFQTTKDHSESGSCFVVCFLCRFEKLFLSVSLDGFRVSVMPMKSCCNPRFGDKRKWPCHLKCSCTLKIFKKVLKLDSRSMTCIFRCFKHSCHEMRTVLFELLIMAEEILWLD